MLAILDTNFNYTFVNIGYATAFSSDADSLVGKNHFNLFPNKLLEGLFIDVIKNKKKVNHKAVSGNEVKNVGSQLHLNWQLKPILENDNCIGLSITITDVSKEHEAIEHGNYLDARYETQFKRNLSGLYWRDLKGRIIKCNDAFAKLLGQSEAADVQNKSIYDFLVISEKQKISRLNEMVDGKINQRENQLKLKDGTLKWVIESGLFFESEDEGRIFEGNIVDITPLKLATDKLEFQKLQLFKAQAKFYAAQMNPHFIFNAINSINSLILDENWEESLIFTTDLANLIRRLLENSVRDSISIADEVHFLNLYLKLEQRRLRTDFKFSIKVPANAALSTTNIPVLVIQPFVENAVHHAMTSMENGEILVEFDITKNTVICTVQDNGPGIESGKVTEKKQESLGIHITKSRLALFNIENSKSEYGIHIDSKKGKGVKVQLTLPIIK